MKNQKWNEKTVEYIKRVKEEGFDLYPMIGRFKKNSKLNKPIPDEVMQEVCLEYVKRGAAVKNTFPYFIKVLENKSRDYFAKDNIREHEAIKKEPVKLKIRLE